MLALSLIDKQEGNKIPDFFLVKCTLTPWQLQLEVETAMAKVACAYSTAKCYDC